MAAPRNMAAVASKRRPGRGFVPPASIESAASPVSVNVAESARDRILHTHREREQHDERVPNEAAFLTEARHRYGERGTHESSLHARRYRQKPRAMMARARADPAAREGPHQERGDRRHRRGNREVGCVGQGEAQEHDVPRHVGHEDVSQREIADGVDQAGKRGEDQQQCRQGAVPIVHLARVPASRRCAKCPRCAAAPASLRPTWRARGSARRRCARRRWAAKASRRTRG